MSKAKWTVLQETENFITLVPTRLYKKITRRIEKGKRVILNPKKIRIAAKDPKKLKDILDKAVGDNNVK